MYAASAGYDDIVAKLVAKGGKELTMCIDPVLHLQPPVSACFQSFQAPLSVSLPRLQKLSTEVYLRVCTVCPLA